MTETQNDTALEVMADDIDPHRLEPRCDVRTTDGVDVCDDGQPDVREWRIILPVAFGALLLILPLIIWLFIAVH